MKKKWRFLWFLLLLAGLSTACQSNKTKTKEELPAIIPIVTETPIPAMEPTKIPASSVSPSPAPDPHKGKERSKLTGLWIKKKAANKRPYAVMLNNIKVANPQSGTSQAVILYEALVEGGITRLMGIFEEFDAKRIGSVRSARHYFVSIADEYDAIFVHYGQTKYAKSKLKKLGIDSLNGLDEIGNTVFYRDSAIKAPHNAFTGYDKITKGTKSKKYRTTYRKNFGHFLFYEKDTDPAEGKKARKVTLKFSGYAAPYFLYNSKEKLYYRYQFGTAHKDKTTKDTLAFKNVIIQKVKQWNIDKNGYQTMDIEDSSGEGYYITNGRAIQITWSKNESKKKMNYYGKDGKELVINPGRTYIAIFPNNRDIVISDKK